MNTWKNRYKNYTTEDFLQDELFIDWIRSGKKSDHIWASRLQENPSLIAESTKAEALLEALQPADIGEDTERIERLKSGIDKKIGVISAKEEFGAFSHTRPKNRRYYLAAAASVCLLLVAYALIRMGVALPGQKLSDNREEIRNTRNGQKLMVHLNDGSKVRLNAGSTIKYQKYFSDSSRVIELEGEAFFEVAKDASRPFRVIAGNTVTEALGTSFNIHTIKNEVNIALVTGKVSVSSMVLQKKIYLTPGDRVSGHKGRLRNVERYGYEEIAWKDDVLLFKDCQRDEVFEELERWYGVSFSFEGVFEDQWNYSGQFDNQTLQAVLMSISYAEEFDFEIQNKEVVIKPK